MAVRRMEARLRAHDFPRLQMTLLVALTGGIGLLASFLMLRLGLDSMALRRTAMPFAATAVFLAVIGAAMSAYAPQAKSIGQVIGHTGHEAGPR